MGELIVSEMLSLDGFYADAEGALDWIVGDEEQHRYWMRLLERTALLLYGRRTWEGARGYWPGVADSDDAADYEVVVARRLGEIPKAVVSSTLGGLDWSAATWRTLDPVREAKKSTAGTVVVFGSGPLVHALARADLVDEYQLIVQPVAVGAGSPLFEPGRLSELALVSSVALASGVVQQVYRPARP